MHEDGEVAVMGGHSEVPKPSLSIFYIKVEVLFCCCFVHFLLNLNISANAFVLPR